ncbi:MAG TPA: Fe(2+)-trafficking protein [Tepidisphaeraceae bacterium]|nr:Fe(2+)-trafficking protein [Tepidisphaeraceae bacterium]
MADAARIEQFRKMASDDPTNELAHFSLGKALLDSGDYQAAADSLRRAIGLNANISKVYQLLGQALLKLGDQPSAIATFTEGVGVADRRGDLLNKNDMLACLKELGAPAPETKPTGPAVVAGEGEVFCRRCGRPGPKLEKPPFRSAFGQEIYHNTCTKCWKDAIGMGTKVINELRLPMADPQAQKMWDQHIREFLAL